MRARVWFLADDLRVVVADGSDQNRRTVELAEEDATGSQSWKNKTSWTPGAVSTEEGAILMYSIEHIIAKLPADEAYDDGVLISKDGKQPTKRALKEDS